MNDPQPAADSSNRPALPPASLNALVEMLGMQAMASLGYVPNPATGKPEVDLIQAKFMIDLLTVIEEKTHGNRSPDEIALLSRLLHETRMAYMHASKAG